jgi:hypothetical protein
LVPLLTSREILITVPTTNVLKPALHHQFTTAQSA